MNLGYESRNQQCTVYLIEHLKETGKIKISDELIETLKDIQESEKAGISLNQWYTGYFENFAKHGHDVYDKLFDFSQ